MATVCDSLTEMASMLDFTELSEVLIVLNSGRPLLVRSLCSFASQIQEKMDPHSNV